MKETVRTPNETRPGTENMGTDGPFPIYLLFICAQMRTLIFRAVGLPFAGLIGWARFSELIGTWLYELAITS
jgi:hypothetical protein